MDDRRIARALAEMEGPDQEERTRRRRNRWRIFLRMTGVVSVLAGVVLAGVLLRPLPRHAELQYTQATIRRAGWDNARRPRFTVTLDDRSRVFVIDPQLAERGGRKLADLAQPGAPVRVGYTEGQPLFGGPPPAWDLAIDGRTIYSLADVRARAARAAPPYWLLTSSLLGAGVILWFVTPPQRRAHHRRRQQ